MTNGGAFVQHDASITLEVLDQRTSCSTNNQYSQEQRALRIQTIVACRLEDLHTLFNGCPRITFVIWGINARQQRNIHAERL
jgi:hypothetical protein